MRVKILTLDSSILNWKTLSRKISTIRKTLGTMKNVSPVTVEIILLKNIDAIPVLNGRIRHFFMEDLAKEHTKDGEAFVMLHLSDEQRKRFGIQPTLRGSAYGDENFYSEAYFWADENTKNEHGNQFIETCLHELSHLMCMRSGQKDLTHVWHKENKTIKGIFKTYDYRQYQAGLVTKIASWLKNYIGPVSLQPLVKRKADLIVKEMAILGHKVHVFEGYRTNQRQNELFAQGRTTKGNIITNAKGGESLHNYGVAVDIVFGEEGKPSWAESHPWVMLGNLGKRHGFTWGGDWKEFSDRPHFEMTLGYSLKDFQDKKIDYNKFS